MNQGTSTFSNNLVTKTTRVFPCISPGNFNFTVITMEIVNKETSELNRWRPSSGGSIPATILRQSVELFLSPLTSAANISNLQYEIAEKLKKSEVIPMHKTRKSPKEGERRSHKLTVA